jgi:hypothetical protein
MDILKEEDLIKFGTQTNMDKHEYHSADLTPLGKRLFDKSEKSIPTSMLDIRKTIWNDYILEWQVIDYFDDFSLRDFYEVTISKIPIEEDRKILKSLSSMDVESGKYEITGEDMIESLGLEKKSFWNSLFKNTHKKQN